MIISLAVFGTCISITIVAAGIYLIANTTSLLTSASSFSVIECVAFASLISSTDPVSTLAVFQSLRVDPTLFYLVFGESVLNDAIAITVCGKCYVMLCYDMLWYVMLWYVMLCYVMSCFMLCHVLCYVMLCYVMSYCIMFC